MTTSQHTHPKSQKQALLDYLLQGNRLTVLKALNLFGVYSLSQRLGELRRFNNIPIQSRTITTPSGKRISEYWLDSDYIKAYKS